MSLLQATQMLNQGKAWSSTSAARKTSHPAHIRDARHIPLKELKSPRISELDKFKSKSVIVVCSSR